MLEIETPAALAEWVGRKLGTSDWITVDQRIIDLFAEATGDHQWIHVDVERAAREMPGGRTIAHGFLTLSLLPRLAPMIYRVVKRSRAIKLRQQQGALHRPGAGRQPGAAAPDGEGGGTDRRRRAADDGE